MANKYASFLLYLVVFVSGAVVMILELTGSRILAPYIGNSLPVWTGLIGIILGSLSVGYILGGKLADKDPRYVPLATILFLSSVSLGIIPILSKLFLPLIAESFTDVRLSVSISAVVLFALPSILLGMVSPFVIRLRLENIKKSGTTSGLLYALSTLGSICGTFLAGFFLIAFLGSSATLYLLAMVMFVLSLLVASKHWFMYSFCLVLSIALLYLITNLFFTSDQPLVEKDTLYNRVTIYDTKHPLTSQLIRQLFLGTTLNSAMIVGSEDLVNGYTKYFLLMDHFVPEIKNVLIIGGGGYSYPKYFQRTHPQANMDIVEIDPELTELAKKYFSFHPNANTTIYHEDARTFFNRQEKLYDAILSDVFVDYAHPFQLVTKEAVDKMYSLLDADGIVISNTISAILGERGKILRAEYHTYKSVFPYVAVFPVSHSQEPYAVQNVMLIASKKPLNFSSSHPELQNYLSTRWKGTMPQDVPLLTDDYAPVEFYTMQIFY